MTNMMTGRLGVDLWEIAAVGAGIFVCCALVAVVIAVGTDAVLKSINGDLD